MNIREYLENHKLLTDGAMGTYFDSIEKENYICSEEANITNPALVRGNTQKLCEKWGAALRSNTFLANEGTFLSLTQAKAEAFENITLKQLIIAGYQLAKETAQEVYQEEYPIFAAAISALFQKKETVKRQTFYNSIMKYVTAFQRLVLIFLYQKHFRIRSMS